MLSASNILFTQFIAVMSTKCGPIHQGPPDPGVQVETNATTNCVGDAKVSNNMQQQTV